MLLVYTQLKLAPLVNNLQTITSLALEATTGVIDAYNFFLKTFPKVPSTGARPLKYLET